MRKILIDANEDIVTMLTSALKDLKTKKDYDFTDMKTLEILNKMLTVIKEREEDMRPSNMVSELTVDQLQKLLETEEEENDK